MPACYPQQDIPLPKDSIFADLITAMETKKPLNINAKISSKSSEKSGSSSAKS